MVEVPVSIRVRNAARVLEFEWADGAVTQLAQQVLRESCRCAECTAKRRCGSEEVVATAVEICGIEPCGPGAVRLHFSDGHARGIYPFAYMRELALI